MLFERLELCTSSRAAPIDCSFMFERKGRRATHAGPDIANGAKIYRNDEGTYFDEQVANVPVQDATCAPVVAPGVRIRSHSGDALVFCDVYLMAVPLKPRLERSAEYVSELQPPYEVVFRRLLAYNNRY